MRYYVVFILMLLLTSCHYWKGVANENGGVTTTSISSYTGIYQNLSSDSVSLWNQLSLLNHDSTYLSNKYTVRLKFITDELVSFDLILNGKIIENKEFEGRIKNGFFEFKPIHSAGGGLPPLLWVWSTAWFRMSFTSNSTFLLERHSGGTAMIVILPAFASSFDVKASFTRY